MSIPPRELFDPDSNDPNRQPVVVWVRCARCAKRHGGPTATAFGRLVYGIWFTDPSTGAVRPGHIRVNRADYPATEAGMAEWASAREDADHTEPVWRWEALTVERHRGSSVPAGTVHPVTIQGRVVEVHRDRVRRRAFYVPVAIDSRQLSCPRCGAAPRVNLATLLPAAVEAATRRAWWVLI